jgi:hypothetical protein
MKSLLFFCLLFFAATLGLKAQNTTTEDTIISGLIAKADLVSRYVWRGQQFGGTCFQPVLEFDKSNFFVGSFGSASITGTQEMQEADLYAGYVLKNMISFSVSDYFFPLDYKKNKYFDYRKDSTKHIFEGAVSFLGTEKIPISLKVATFFYGNDFKNKDGSIAYSTYAELQYSKKIHDADLMFFTGAALNKPDDKDGYYGNEKSFAVVNAGVKIQHKIQISKKFTLPIYSILTVNPSAQNIWLVFGITLAK